MKSLKIAMAALAFLAVGCKDDDKLFSVATETELLSLVQSTNVAPLTSDSLKLYLTSFELRILDTATTTFKRVVKIMKKQNFKVLVLLQTSEAAGRSYEFLVRTYKDDWAFIDSYQLGIWNEKEKYFCYGSVGKDLTIEKKCVDDQLQERLKIDDDGRIVKNPDVTK
jgi:hypothetical protein